MLSGRIQNKFLHNFLLFSILILLCIWSVWGVVVHFKDGLVAYGDTLLITWIINQNIQKIPFHLLNLFQGNIFYPFKDTIAYADIFLPSSILAYIPVKLFSHLPAAAYNFSLIISQILTVSAFFFWFSEITKDKLSSLAGSIGLAFSQIKLFFQGYLQMWAMEWVILSLWMIWKYRQNPKVRYLVFAALFSAIAMWESPLPVMFIIFSGFFILLPVAKSVIHNVRHLILPAIVFTVTTLPLTLKYFEVSKEFGIIRSIREAAHFSMNLNDLWGILFSPGLFSLLIISFILLTKDMWKKQKDLYWLAWIGITGVVMALGPVLKYNEATFKIFGKIFIPLPYGIFYYLIPAFKGFRTPLRWIWLLAFAVSGIFVVVASQYKSKYKNIILLGCILLAVLGGSRITRVLPVPSPENYPQVYGFIKNEPGKVIIELPMYSWGVGEPFQHEFWRMFYSLEHGKKLVNGASGLNPPDWEELQYALWKDFPDTKTEEKLKEISVDYVVIHKDEYDSDKLEKIEIWGAGRTIWEDSSTEVVEL